MSQPMKCVAYPRYTPELPGTHAPRNLVSFIRVCCFHLLSILSRNSTFCIQYPPRFHLAVLTSQAFFPLVALPAQSASGQGFSLPLAGFSLHDYGVVLQRPPSSHPACIDCHFCCQPCSPGRPCARLLCGKCYPIPGPKKVNNSVPSHVKGEQPSA